MITTRHTVAVPASVETVWAAVTDWPRQGEWVVGTTVFVTAGDGAGVGSELAAFTGVGSVGFLDTMEIVGWEPPHRCEVRHTGRLVRGTGVFTVQPTADGAELVWEERLEPPLGRVGELVWPLVRPLFDRRLRRSLAHFAEFCRRHRR
ncbi:polyketide cyclase [Longimycelium tulufanense]|uniref:Polyketide cyclase n=1 Tax=Longimycelium tulufanense TaxID=907463 RepID=A0A8J3C8X2_9PSEU|nr:SRPBCC family protein [Longimycelium tulufanense]GGM42914.1 polyketide cyclase [Longimycelium tulufanense]